MILIDGDIVAYRCAASCEPSKTKAMTHNDPQLLSITEPFYVALGRMESLMSRILEACQTDQYKLFLSGSENFRKIIYPDYKAHRKNITRPTWLEDCREYLVLNWKASICDGYEADDGIGIAHTPDSIVAGIDKDLLQLPGKHFNFVRNEFLEVSDYSAERKIWELMLTGDSADGIRGVHRIGPIKAHSLLEGTDRGEWSRLVRALYADDERFRLNLRLITVLRSVEEWEEVRKLNENSFRSNTDGKTSSDEETISSGI